MENKTIQKAKLHESKTEKDEHLIMNGQNLSSFQHSFFFFINGLFFVYAGNSQFIISFLFNNFKIFAGNKY